jgi:hypothetical protein
VAVHSPLWQIPGLLSPPSSSVYPVIMQGRSQPIRDDNGQLELSGVHRPLHVEPISGNCMDDEPRENARCTRPFASCQKPCHARTELLKWPPWYSYPLRGDSACATPSPLRFLQKLLQRITAGPPGLLATSFIHPSSTECVFLHSSPA